MLIVIYKGLCTTPIVYSTIRDIQYYYVTGIGNAIEIPVAILARLVPMLVVNFCQGQLSWSPN